MKKTLNYILITFLIAFTSLIANAQNTINIKVYDDDITTKNIDGTTKDLFDVSSSDPSQVRIQKILVYNESTNQIDYIEETTNGLATLNIADGTYTFFLTGFNRQVGDQLPISTLPNGYKVTGVSVGEPGQINKITEAAIRNVTINSNQTIVFGFAPENKFGSITGGVYDYTYQTSIALGGFTIQLQFPDGTIYDTFTTQHSGQNAGLFWWNSVPFGEYNIIQIQNPLFQDVLERDGGSDREQTDGTKGVVHNDGKPNNIYVKLDETDTASTNFNRIDLGNFFWEKVTLDLDSCHTGTTESKFEWSAAEGSGNEWLNSDSGADVSKTYQVAYQDNFNNNQTIDVTVRMLDPDGINVDDNFQCQVPTGVDQCVSVTGGTGTNKSFGSKFLSISQSTTTNTQTLTFEFTFSKSIFVKNFSISDIDWNTFNTINGNNTNTWTSYRDQVTVTAENNGTNIPLNYVIGDNLQLNGNVITTKEYKLNADGSGINGDSSPSYPTNNVYISSQDQVNKITVVYQNAEPDNFVNNGDTDPGHSQGNAIRLNGFTFCAVDYAALGGQVLEDTNNNGSGDTAIADPVIIQLLDSNGDPARDANGTLIGDITTSDGTTDVNGDGNIDPAGSYFISGLALGTYKIVQVQPNDYTTVTTNELSVTLTSNVENLNNNFVERKTTAASQPVHLISFSAEKADSDVIINWTTATEEENDGFIIEYSIDGIQFNELAKVAGNGNKQTESNYSYTHQSITNLGYSKVSYRLVQIDFDGTKTNVSNIASVQLDSRNTQIIATPNPANAGEQITVQGISGMGSYSIYNIDGQVVLSNEYETNSTLKIQTESLSSGIYFVRFKHLDKSVKFIIK